MTSTGGERCGGRALRADAATNRERLVAAARRVFGRDGVGAPLTTVADEAGVGIATLYRRFPDRDALVRAAFDEALVAFDEVLVAAGDTADPWDAFAAVVVGMGELEARDRGFAHLLQSAALPLRGPGGLRERGYTTVLEVLRRGQEAGAIRPDLTTEDVPVIAFAIAGILEATRDDVPGAWRRHVALVLEGCRARPDTDPLPPAPPVRGLQRAMIRSARRRTGSGDTART